MFRLLALIVLLPPACLAEDLFHDDFARIPPRVLSEPVKQLTNAIQEYHYLAHRGVSVSPWENAIVHDDVWAGGDEDGKPYLEQHAVNDSVRWTSPLMVTGDPGLQLMTVNFWRNPGIVTLFDHEGSILAQEEPIHSGSPLLPVNWKGDGQEYAFLSGNVHEGGLIDGHLRRVVLFPDDGHPDLTGYVADLTGDARDEIVLWDSGRVWIYTQDRPFTGKRIYRPVRNPDYNESNYRTTVSLPAWEDFGARLKRD